MQVEVEFRLKSFLFLPKQNLNMTGYMCMVKDFKVIGPNSDKIVINGVHQEDKDNFSVVGVSIRKQLSLNKFPRGFGLVFPNLMYLEIDTSAIAALDREDFVHMAHLQGIWMPNNPIVSLPNDLFANVQGLRFLSFHKNKLKYIGHDLLKPLKNLKLANFEGNTTIDISYNGKQEELDNLNREIALKCMAPKASSLTEASRESIKVMQLEKRVQLLETKVKKLETGNSMQTAKLAQVAALSQMVAIMQSRVESLEIIMQ